MAPTVIIEFPYTPEGMRQAQDVADQYGGKVSMDATESGPLKGDSAKTSKDALGGVGGPGGLGGLSQILPGGDGASPEGVPPPASADLPPGTAPGSGAPPPGLGLGLSQKLPPGM